MELLLLLACVLLTRQVRAHDAECKGTDFEWSYNAQKQSPCKVANALVGTCGNAPFAALDAQTAMWGGPGDDKSPCLCSLVEYNLLRVCALCQDAADGWVEPFKDWAKNCGDSRKVEFPNPAPGGTSIPAWASKGDLNGEWSLDPLKAAAAPPPPPPSSSASSAKTDSPSPSPSPKPGSSTTSSTPPPSSSESSNEAKAKASGPPPQGNTPSPTPTPVPSPSPSNTASHTSSQSGASVSDNRQSDEPESPSGLPLGSYGKQQPSNNIALGQSTASSDSESSATDSETESEDNTSTTPGTSLTLPIAALAAQTDSDTKSSLHRSGTAGATPGHKSSIEALDGAKSLQTGIRSPLPGSSVSSSDSDSSSTKTPADTPNAPSPTPLHTKVKTDSVNNPTSSSSSTSLGAEHEQLIASTDPFSGVNSTMTEISSEEAERAGRVKIGIIAGSLAGAFLLIFIIFRLWTCHQYRKDLRETVDPETFEKVLARPTQSTIWQNIRGASFMPRRLAAPVDGAKYAVPGASMWENIRNSMMPRRGQSPGEQAVPPVPSMPAEYAQQGGHLAPPPPPPPKSLAALRNIPTALRPGSRRNSEEDQEETLGHQEGLQAGYGHGHGPIPTINVEASSPPAGLQAPLYEEREGERASWI